MRIVIPIKVIMLFSFSLLFITNALPQQYILLGWNDLGMHCSNKDFSKIAVLPPYNNIHAQLIMIIPNGLPKVVTSGYTVEYSIPGNTYSVGKTNFWTYAQQLFNLSSPLTANIGLTGNGLSGIMDTTGNFFIATAIPATPYQDNNLTSESPFQTIHLVAKDISSGNLIAVTDVVIPVSNEIGCVQSGCHSSEQAILDEHESVSGFSKTGPNLCAKCHASNALGTTGNSEAGIFSYRIHNTHKDLLPQNDINTCYKCHPGPNTQCFRGVMRTGISNPLICQNCHGNLSDIASSIKTGRRPWLDEPKCGNITCHGNNFSEEQSTLFRMSKGHGGLTCSACHGSPHAIYPTLLANDNLQNIRLQGFAGTLKDCLVCHSTPPTGPGPHGILYEPTGITNILTAPKYYSMDQNYPNPFNPSTTIEYQLPRTGLVNLKVYDILGKEVSTLVNEIKTDGYYKINFDASNLANGVYIYQLKTNDFIISKKMIFLK